MLGYYLNLNLEDYQTLLDCGAAAGISAIFNAPFGGIMFATEILFSKIK